MKIILFYILLIILTSCSKKEEIRHIITYEKITDPKALKFENINENKDADKPFHNGTGFYHIKEESK